MASQDTSVSNEQLASALINNRQDLAKLIDDYYRQAKTIAELEEGLKQIRQENTDAQGLLTAMQATIDQLKERNDVLKEIFLASQDTNKKQVAEFQKQIDAANARARKNFFKGLGWGAIAGAVLTTLVVVAH